MDQLQTEIPEFASIQELENVFKTTREAIFVHDYECGKILHVNEAMLGMYGLSRQEVMSIDVDNVTGGKVPHTVEEVRELFKKVKELGEIAFEWHDRRKNGQFFWTDNVIKIAKIDGQLRILVLARDITERKKKQLQLQTRVREHSHEIVELNEKLTLANEELKIINEELETYRGQLENLVTSGTNELKKSEEKFSNVFHHNPCFIIVSRTKNGEIMEVNEAFTKKIGYTVQELSGRSLSYFEIIEKSQHRKILGLLNGQGYYKNLEITICTKEKEKLICLGSGKKIMIGPHEIFIETIRDITELKSIEQRLSLAEIRYSHFIEQNTEGISYFRPDVPVDISLPPLQQARKLMNKCILVECNPSFCRMYGSDTDSNLLNKTMLEISGDILEDDVLTLLREFVQSGHRLINYQTSEIAENGTQQYFIHNLLGIIKDHKLIGLWNSRRNITDLKKTEDALDSERRKNEEAILQNEERFLSIVQYLTDIILILDANRNIVYESPSTRQVLGYDAGFLIGKPCLSLVHPEELSQVTHALDEVFSHTSDENPIEFRVKHKEGHWISLEAIGNNLLSHPAIQGIVITCRDITERKRVEKALTLSESKFRNIFNNSSDAIIMVDASYNILEVNEVFLKITGYTMEDTRKMKFSEIITDTYLPEMVDQLVRFIQLENPPAIESEILCKSKRSIPVEINSKIIEFEGEIALVSIIRVITERRQLETRILDTIISTEEKEREKFARNLHDELGPLLSSIKMYINSLSAGMEKEKHDFITSQLKKILTEAIQCTKEVSNDLSPHVLADYGLLAALEWFNNQIKPYISITLETNLKDERYATSLELAIYRIIKELINNTLKHAQANSITIKLHRILRSFHLVYSDNGKGFPAKWQDNFESMGMGMSNIMSRCRSIKANSKFYNHAPHGMSFELQVPL